MNSTKLLESLTEGVVVWEICKFWILQNDGLVSAFKSIVWEICKFWILQNFAIATLPAPTVWEICKFWILQNEMMLLSS